MSAEMKEEALSSSSESEQELQPQMSPPEVRISKKKRPPIVQGSVKRRHLLAAITAVRNFVEPDGSSKRREHYSFPQRYPQSGKVCPMWQTPKANLLLVLRNAISHHDWSTAAHVLKFMCDARLQFQLFIGPFFQVLFNHPESNVDSVRQFLSEAFNLRSKEEQQTFLGHLFHLPQHMDVYKEPVMELGDIDDTEW